MRNAFDLSRRISGFAPAARLRAACAAAMLLVAGAAQSGETKWLTGAGLDRQLAGPATINWRGGEVRKMVESFARFQYVAVLLDRRVDTSKEIEATFNSTLAETLGEVAKLLDAGYSQVGPVAYIGPAATARKLRTIVALRRADVQKLPTNEQKPWLTSAPWKWNDLATPRELVEQLAASNGMTIEGLDRLPHDLWAAADLPPLSLVERLSLVLGQFDLTFSLDPTGRKITLVPVPEEVFVERDYPAGSQPQATLERLKTRAPNSQVELHGQRIVVRGPIEDHEQLAERAAPAPKTPPAGVQVHTLNLDNVPLAAVLASLEKQLKLGLRVDTEGIKTAGLDLNQLISVHVERVSTDELLKAVVEPAGLEIREIEGRRVVVVKK